MMTRRQILRTILQTGAALPFVNYTSLNHALARDPILALSDNLPPIEDRVIVLLRMFGGNDGLNTLVPFTNDIYYKIRGDNPGGSCAIAPKDVLRISGTDSVGFHHAMPELRNCFDDGKMAILQNVGYPNQDLSHFRSTDIWLSGSDADKFEESGWMGRYLESKYPHISESPPLHPPAIEFTRSVSRLLQGSQNQYGFAYRGTVPVPEKPGNSTKATFGSKREQDYVLTMQNQSHVYLKTLTAIEENSVKNTLQYPKNNTVGEDLAHVARLVASGLESSVFSLVTDNMFDNHEGLILYHDQALKIIDSAVGAFQQDIENLGIADRIVLVLYSEFGRRLAPTGSGTDHGAAGPVFVIGSNIKGGLYGKNPDLNNLDADGNLRFDTDFRQIYATLLSSWFGVSAEAMFPMFLPHLVNKISFINSPSLSETAPLISPNPCTTKCTVSIHSKEINSLKIFSIEGRQYEPSLRFNQSYGVDIDVSVLASGAYYIEGMSGNQKFHGSFVKMTQ
ncbi:MAG: DUF1501 domain-containing protein [Ignavibacteria bacterium]|nr:DUF1501 domain-containing protein [Ignavibacteria bacterium]